MRQVRPIRFDAPPNRLSGDGPEGAGGKWYLVIAPIFRQAHHLPHLNDDLGKWQSALLSLRYPGSHRVTEALYEGEEPLVVPRD